MNSPYPGDEFGAEASSRPTIRPAQRREPTPVQPSPYDQPLPSRRELRRREAAQAAGGSPAAPSSPDAPPLRQGSGHSAPTAPQAAVPQAAAQHSATAPVPGAGATSFDTAVHGSAAGPETAAGGAGDGAGGGSRRDRRRPPEREPLGPIRGTIRTFGELCITAGLILILFVVWQLWWTDIEANRGNEVLADELTEDWSNQDPNKLPEDPDEPVVAEPVAKNEAFGIFYIPRFGDDYYRTVAEGVDMEPVLNRMGVGRYPNSAMPGEIGNFSIAGHRVTYGKPLNKIANLRPGDEIIVQTKDGFYTYTFRNFDIILPDAVEVLAPVPDMPEAKGKDRILTMTACNPMFSARERYVAYAELTDWTPAGGEAPESIRDSQAYQNVSKNGGA
ncbi:LPXTG-site transpeptidase (sortase) family protein [Brevibacterium sanguinis]|uniref:LPXTG-site transpeptidase (Sortase) family protein n=2 Tax=Brevibacterium TaxID=1696 RepID=A0A366IM50_9MICO|nr:MULTISPECIES: class E sortase [Brevibacterium]RBP67291.1 LPXTG-site transpeptidase (sortase) family protein [Brevibacterium sanguinis]RBP73816.1 LPXTG-site transpeptidase (sortase) family protein [Brevibacterium celere]